jgi:hypothetical protein
LAFFYIKIMKKLILFIAMLSVLSFAQKKNNALGFWIGSGGGWGGVDLKHLNSDNTVWDVYLGPFEIGSQTRLGIGVGYYFLFHPIKADASVGRFPLHIGPTVGFGYWSGGEKPNQYDGLDLSARIAGGISWFTPTTPMLDVSIELTSPGIGHWHENREQQGGEWKTNYGPGFGLRSDIGLRLLFHVYFF